MQKSIPWTALLNYDSVYAPPPETVVTHIVHHSGTPTVDEWGLILRYLAVRCGQEQFHYRPAVYEVGGLFGGVQRHSHMLNAGLSGVCIFAMDAEAAVAAIRGAGTFHREPYAWICFPPNQMGGDVEGSPAARLHLQAQQFYTRRLRAGVPSAVLGLHALLLHCVVRDNPRLLWAVVVEIAHWGGVPDDHVPHLMDDSFAIIDYAIKATPNNHNLPLKIKSALEKLQKRREMRLSSS